MLPYHRLIDVPAESDTLALLPLWWLHEVVLGLDTIPVVVVAAAAAICLLFLTVSPRFALLLPAVVLLWFAFATERIERFDHGFPKASIGALYEGITTTPRDWVDAAVGRNADVAFVFSGRDKTHHPDTLWENEFYNRSIGPVYDLRQPSMGGLPETRVTERADGVLLADGKPIRHRYVLSEESVPLAGVRREPRRAKGHGSPPHARLRADRLPRRGPLRERHLVRQDRHLHASALHRGASDRDRLERSEALQRSADG